MFEDYLIQYCAPTLAGIKTANLFNCPYEDRDALLDAVRHANRRFRDKGLRVLPLKFSESRALIYIYRPKRLSSDLTDASACELLENRGYDTDNHDKCVCQLCRKLRQQKDFPHEIGLFLGYPPEDVSGFIENKACDFKCVGCWKVYGDPEAAQKKFDQYKKCTKAYCHQWAKRRDLNRLAIAG